MQNRTDSYVERAETDATHWNAEKPEDRPATSGSGSSLGTSSSADYEHNIGRLQSRGTEVDLERNRSNTSEALSRIETHRLQHALTVGESVKSRSSRQPLPAFGAGKPYPPPLPNRDDYVVEFDGPNDPIYPKNWSTWTK